MSGIPSYYGAGLTPTYHHKLPSNIDPSKTTLPRPFVVVVTGAGKGLGKHISLAYARAGCSGLSISSRTMTDLEALEAEIGGLGGGKVEVLKSVCDVQDEESVLALEREVRAKWGRVDVVVANAGIISKYIEREKKTESNLPIGIIEDDDWKRVLDINLYGVWRITKAFMSLLTETKNGPQSLIASSSLAASNFTSHLCPIAYNISKMSVTRLVEHIAADHGADGIHAYALHPGAVLTPQTQNHTREIWNGVLCDDEGLAGAFCVWLTREKRSWLSGRFVVCNWDVDELEARREEIVQGDKLKFRLVV